MNEVKCLDFRVCIPLSLAAVKKHDTREADHSRSNTVRTKNNDLNSSTFGKCCP